MNTEGEVICDEIELKRCVFNPHVNFSLMSMSCMEDDGWVYTQGGGSGHIVRGEVSKELVR